MEAVVGMEAEGGIMAGMEAQVFHLGLGFPSFTLHTPIITIHHTTTRHARSIMGGKWQEIRLRWTFSRNCQFKDTMVAGLMGLLAPALDQQLPHISEIMVSK
jgi:hypothetical protein